MIPTDLSPLVNHLWQSTLCAAAVWLLTLALRRNRAAVRYWLWLAASVKFFVPFSLLVSVGSQFAWHTTRPIKQPEWFLLMEFGQPLSASSRLFRSSLTSPAHSPVPLILFGLWLVGFGVGVLSWLRRWRQVRAAMRHATPLQLATAIPVLSCSDRLEPGVFGIVRPVLLLPEGITRRLTGPQLQTLIAHEICHARRHDNLSGAIHMAVEAVFWFHPLVWWIESKLVEERERACDEEVLRLGNDPEVYAESILSVCKHYLESPLVCLSAVSGGRLRQRIDYIMANYATRKLDFSRKFMLLSAGTAVILAPIILGLVTRQTFAQSKVDTPKPLVFEVASIKATKNTIGPNTNDISPGGQRFSATNSPLKLLIMIAYDVGDRRVSGGPGWVNTDSYDIEAKAEHPASRQQIHLMLQSLLAERFNLRLHRETKDLPMYVLTAENYRTHLRENTSGGEFRVSRGSGGQLVFENAPISQLTWFLSVRLRSEVEDKTGLTGKYDFELAPMPTGPETAEHNPNSSVFMPPGPDGPSVFATLVREQLGLKLTATKGPVELLVIDHAEKPSAN